MKNNRRKFLRQLAIGSGALAAGIPALARVTGTTDEQMERSATAESNGHFVQHVIQTSHYIG